MRVCLCVLVFVCWKSGLLFSWLAFRCVSVGTHPSHTAVCVTQLCVHMLMSCVSLLV
jgi:hypothetical protein